jgi:hypothetical protein
MGESAGGGGVRACLSCIKVNLLLVVHQGESVAAYIMNLAGNTQVHAAWGEARGRGGYKVGRRWAGGRSPPSCAVLTGLTCS